MRKLGALRPNAPSLLLLMAAPLWEESLLWLHEATGLYTHLRRWTLRGPDSKVMFYKRKWHSPSGHLQWRCAAMETKATDDGGALKTAPPAYARSPKPQRSECCSTTAAVCSSAVLLINLGDRSNACLLKMNLASNAAWKEKTFVIKLSLRLSSHVVPPWPKNKTLASVEYHLAPMVAG